MDVKLCELERNYKTTNSTDDLIKLWSYQRRYGIEPSHLPAEQMLIDFIPDMDPDKSRGFSGCSIGPAIPGDTISLEWSPVKYVYFEDFDSLEYTHDKYIVKYIVVVELEDGRFASISKNEYGTCEECSSADESVSYANSLQDIITYGLTDDQRHTLGISNPS